MAGKRPNGDGTIYQRNDGYWIAQLTIYDEDGNSKRKTFSGKSQKIVKEKIDKAKKDLMTDGKVYEPSKITFDKFSEEWLVTVKPTIKYLTYQSYSGILKTHLLPKFGKYKLSDFTRYKIQRYINELTNTGKLVHGEHSVKKNVRSTELLSPKTIKNIHGVLSRVLQYAVDMELIKSNPAAGLKHLPKIEKSEIHPLTSEEIILFLKALKGNRYENFFLVTLFSGMRESESVGLLWENVDFERGAIVIDKQWRRETKQFETTKNGKEREVYLPPFVMQALKNEQTKQVEKRLEAAEHWQGWKNIQERPNWFVFTNDLGGVLLQNTLLKAFKKILKEAGIPERKIHDLRHTFATMSLHNGDDIKTVQENLGHATAAFTLSVYAHSTDEMKKASASRMENFFQILNQPKKGTEAVAGQA